MKILRRYTRRFSFGGSGAIQLQLKTNNPIMIHSILCYTADPLNTWWISFDQQSGSGTIIQDSNWDLNGGGTLNIFATMVMAIQTQPAPITYKYFPYGGFLLQSVLYCSLRTVAAAVLVAPTTDYIEIDYSYAQRSHL